MKALTNFMLKSAIAASLITFGVMLPKPAQAINWVTDRTALGANDYIDWGTLGSSSTPVANPSPVTSNLGSNATISQANVSNMEILQQGVGWAGNFAPNDFVLWTNGNRNGPLTISFANPVFGAGAQIQTNNYGNFTVNLTAYDGSDNVLGNFTSVGNSTANADNPAIFIGVNDNVASISKLIFSVPVTQDFAINRLAIATAVPWETDVLSVVGTTILFGFGVWSKSKSTKSIQK
jgi:hypothetical protein